MGRIDEELVRDLAPRLGTLSRVRSATVFPRSNPRTLVIELEVSHYPPIVDSVQLDIDVYVDGRFNIHYTESHAGEQQNCRWDRHQNDHNTRDHFHPPPDASRDAALDRAFEPSVIETLRQHVFPWVDERIGILWDAAQ